MSASPPSLSRALLRSPWLRPLTDVAAIDDFLAQIDPTWSLVEIRARITDRIAETADTTTLVLEANRHWPGFAAGQHVALTVEIDGVRHTRTFSLSSAPDRSRRVHVTVKNQGEVTRWINDAAPVGAVVTLSAPRGDFVLPADLPGRLLMISAGSGITPVMSMLRALAARPQRPQRPQVYFVHACRTESDAIFGAELRLLASRWPGLTLIPHHSARDGRLTPERLAQLVPDFARLPTFLCGPTGFMAAIEAEYARRDALHHLRFERFGAPPAPAASGVAAQVSCTRSERSFAADGAQPLLLAAERAGLQPKSGCRIGICMTCKCRKASGTVQNLLTGAVSSEPGEMIQLCISAARSDVTLDL